MMRRGVALECLCRLEAARVDDVKNEVGKRDHSWVRGMEHQNNCIERLQVKLYLSCFTMKRTNALEHDR